jgi:hypothetical protein
VGSTAGVSAVAVVRSESREGVAIMALYGSATVLKTIQAPPAGAGIPVVTVPPSAPLDSGSTVAGVKPPLTATASARGGQGLLLRLRTDKVYGITLDCHGGSGRVSVLVLIDGTEPDKRLAPPGRCDELSTGYTANTEAPQARTVEVRVTGPDSAVVTVGLYGARVASDTDLFSGS